MPIKRYTRRTTTTHPYHNYHHRRYKQPVQRFKLRWIFAGFTCVMLGISLFFGYLYLRPLPTLTATNQLPAVKTIAPTLSWPQNSQAAFGTIDQGLLASKPGEVARPTASTAKVITALVVLEKKPLQIGEKGPEIVMTQADVDNYNRYFAVNGSLAEIHVGEKLTEYEMLQGLLLPSANNYADTLAIWAFGSMEEYRKAATVYVQKLSMKNTVIGDDASGFSPTTQSTASDLTRLAVAAMKHPVVTEISQQESVILPVAGLKNSTNHLLGVDGIIGLKTGNTDEAGGVYLFAARYALDSTHSTVIVGAIQGESTVAAAMGQARALLAQIRPHFVLAKPVIKGQVVSTYQAPWRQKAKAIADKDISIMIWPGKNVETKVSLENILPSSLEGSKVGNIAVGEQISDVILQESLQPPSWKWRIWRESEV